MPALTRDSNPSRAVISRVRLSARSCAATSSLRECTFPFTRVLTLFDDVFILSDAAFSEQNPSLVEYQSALLPSQLRSFLFEADACVRLAIPRAFLRPTMAGTVFDPAENATPIL